MSGTFTSAARVGRCVSGWLRKGLAVLVLGAGGAAVAQVVISPVIVEFAAKQRVATVRITLSDSARPMRLQAQLLRWRQGPLGESVTEPSADLIVSPRIAELRPGQTQVLRLALRPPLPADAEMAYRLLLEDVADPVPTSMGQGASVKFRMAYDLPVLVPPKGPVIQALQWRPCPAEAPRVAAAGTLCVRVANAGNRRVKIQSLQLEGDNWQLPWKLQEPQNILAGDEAQWNIRLSREVAGPLRALSAHTVQGEVLQARAAGS